VTGGPQRLLDDATLKRLLGNLQGHHEADTECIVEHIAALEELLRRSGAILATPGCPGREALAAEIASVLPSAPRRAA